MEARARRILTKLPNIPKRKSISIFKMRYRHFWPRLVNSCHSLTHSPSPLYHPPKHSFQTFLPEKKAEEKDNQSSNTRQVELVEGWDRGNNRRFPRQFHYSARSRVTPRAKMRWELPSLFPQLFLCFVWLLCFVLFFFSIT